MKKRLITAIILLAIFIPLIIIGGIYFEMALALISALAFKELLDLISKEKKIPLLIKVLSYITVVILTLCMDSFLPCILLSIILFFIPLIFIKEDNYTFIDALKIMGLVLFVGTLFYDLNYIRNLSLESFIYIVLITTLTDTFAYIGGKLFGKNKLIPRVSPNKTIEGSIIGTLVGTIIPSIYYLYEINQGMNLLIIILITIILSIFGQLGDLLFSSIKRRFNIKDFSNILPGHGGILDRLDSILITCAVYIIMKTLFL